MERFPHGNMRNILLTFAHWHSPRKEALVAPAFLANRLSNCTQHPQCETAYRECCLGPLCVSPATLFRSPSRTSQTNLCVLASYTRIVSTWRIASCIYLRNTVFLFIREIIKLSCQLVERKAAILVLNYRIRYFSSTCNKYWCFYNFVIRNPL
jgi:hypothetical protein